MRMHSPTHPGKVLREFLGDVGVTTAAKHLKVSRARLSRRYVTASFRRVRDARWNLV